MFDYATKRMSADSRWSKELDERLVYIDDSGFDKILLLPHLQACALFAGNGQLIQEWQDWLRTDLQGPHPAVEADGTSIVMRLFSAPDGECLNKQGSGHELPEGYFAGSGAIHAIPCFKQNKCVIKAVETAKERDVMTGGEVKFTDLVNGSNNLKDSARIEHVVTSLVDRGYVMYIRDRKVVPFQEAAANDAKVHRMKRKLLDGALSVDAPCSEMYVPWNDEQKQSLEHAIDVLRGRLRKA
ncbi:hypothetical protein [Chitinolyticbacter meiyuanensis]|uniref:hypothetical protein n=1 Tax=Chitinolyticbacter meiyuanensis TaxID=682798 RepID=UPI0011E5FAA0|nr:hypothetical protein [Chitinolyticbacter meiyuanensis]